MESKSASPQREHLKGVIFILSSAFFFSLMMVFVRLSGDIPSIQKSFFRNLVALIFAILVLLRSMDKIQLRKGDFPPLLFRAIFGTIGILGNFYATDHLMLSDATMLNKLSPFFAIIFSYVLLKEKVKPLQILAVVLAFSGSLFIIKPSGQGILSSGSIAGLIGGLGAGVAYTCVRILGTHGVKGSFIVFFFSAFSCLATLPFLVFDFHPMTTNQLIFLILAGLCATGGQFSITAAYSHAPAREFSIFDYTQVIFAALLGFIIFGQIPDLYSVIGYFIICGISVVMFFYNKKNIF